MKKPFGMPGIGGSLGQCGLCGQPFLMEILLGRRVKSFDISGCDSMFYGHDECLEKFGDKNFDVELLPDASPIKRAYIQQKAKTEKEIA